MKKYIVIAALLLCGSAFAQLKPAPLSAVIGGSAWTNDGFDNIGGSFVIGPQVLIDADKGLYIRTTYHRINFGTPGVSSLDISALMDWYLGAKWKFLANVGASNYLDGVNDGTDLFLGFGVERLIWYDPNPAFTIPFSVSAYADLTMTDATGSGTGGFSQINIGLRFSKPSK